MELDRCRYIVVEGPIGAGKTTLARELAIKLHGETLFEQPDENPFLARFYDDMARFALPTQLTFLFQRADQLRGLAQLDFFRRPTIADFLLVFAGRRLPISCSTRTHCSRGSTCPTTNTRSTRRSTRI